MMKPWEHYVPVKADLSDLKERYDWAESHPSEARRISKRATALVKSFGERSAFESIFGTFYKQPLNQIVAGYQPAGDTSWQEAVDSASLHLLLKCKYYDGGTCEELQSK